jgi:hypothetical protein
MMTNEYRTPEETEEEALERVEEEREELDDYLEEQGIYIRQ